MNENDKWKIFRSISYDRGGTPADEQFAAHNLYGGLLAYRRLKKEKKKTHLQSFIVKNLPRISFE